MRFRTLAHLSDLHIGRSPASDRAAAALASALLAQRVDHVVVTGDVTHRGRLGELATFHALYAPLFAEGRITVVPGNHDRWNDGVAKEIMKGKRVDVARGDGLYLVRVDSSGPQNRAFWISEGRLTRGTLAEIDAAFDDAPPSAVSVLLLHHHLVPQPEETLAEGLAAFLGWPHVGELPLGRALLERLRGRCDLILHGHRHVPGAFVPWPDDARPLEIYNAGSSTELERVRLFSHAAGLLQREPSWLEATPCWPSLRSASL
jgi:predicted phosphodiesterase